MYFFCFLTIKNRRSFRQSAENGKRPAPENSGAGKYCVIAQGEALWQSPLIAGEGFFVPLTGAISQLAVSACLNSLQAISNSAFERESNPFKI